MLCPPHVACRYERRAIEAWLRTRLTSPVTNEPLESPRLIPNVIVRGMVRAARLRTRLHLPRARLHLPRGDLASARGVSPCTPARRCASCARRILGSSELSMRYALKAVQYLYLGRVARRSPCIEESGGRRKFGPQTTPQDTGVARSPHTPTTSTGTIPTVRIFTDTRRRSRTQLLPRRRRGNARAFILTVDRCTRRSEAGGRGGSGFRSG